MPPAEAQVSCGGREHRLRWAAGELLALDHSDAEGERILSVLGGQHCPCLDAMDAWASHADDLRVLVLASRGPVDPVPVPIMDPVPGRRLVSSGGGVLRARGGFGGPPAYRGGPVHRGGPASRDPEEGLAALLGLGGPMQDRLTATVVAAWRERLRASAAGGAGRAAEGAAEGDEGDAEGAAAVAGVRPALHAALYGRVTAALRAWTGRPDLRVGLTMISEAQRPALTSDADGIAVELPLGWLIDVWAKGLCTFWGRFCLAAAPAEAGWAEAGWVLSTVSPDLGPPRPISVGNPPAD
jgi:hypothetical protein